MEQRTPEWFEARKGRVTASVVGAILGLSPHMARTDVIRSMVRAHHGEPVEFTGNVATEWGSHNELGAKAEFCMETLHDIQEVGFIQHPTEDWAGASPDGLINGDGGLEIKCPYGLRNDNPPKFLLIAEQEHYLAQIQFTMWVTERKWWYAYQWAPHGTKLERVERDEDWIATNISALKQFHAEFLSELDNPDHLEPVRVIIDTPQAHKMMTEYDELVEQIALAEERKKELLAEMVAIAGDRNALMAGRKLTLVQKKGAVSYAKAIKSLVPDANLEPWRGKPSNYWQVS